MTWLRLDDQIAFHAKTIGAGNAAFGAWVRLTAWSCAQLTDGCVPAHVARSMATPSELRRLIDVGYLDRIDGGFAVHNFLDWNPKAADVTAARENEKRRKAQGRAKQGRSAESGRITTVSAPVSGVCPAGQPVGQMPPSARIPPARPPVPSGSRPDPDPDPDQQNPPNPPPGGVSAGPSADVGQARRRASTGGHQGPSVGSDGQALIPGTETPPSWQSVPAKAEGKKEARSKTRTAVLRDRADDIAVVLECWREQPYHGSRPIITLKRQVRVADRLFEGGTVEELCEAIKGVGMSPYHLGQNDSGTKYVDIDNVFRERGQIERLADLYRAGPGRSHRNMVAALPIGIQPPAAPGESAWVAGDGKNWLKETLQEIEES